MHEMALTRNVVDIVCAEAERVGASRVGVVRVSVGEARDIVDEIFVDMFAWLARGTVAEGARVELERIPLRVRCRQCGSIYPINVFDESSWPCPLCLQRSYDLVSGMEFTITSIEVSS